MNEQDWLTCTNPRPLLQVLRGKARDRKLRLFAIACCRRVWPLLSDARNRIAVEAAEGFADSIIGERQLEEARNASYAVFANTSEPGTGFADAAVGISRASWEAAQAATVAAMTFSTPNEAIRCADIAAEQIPLAVSCSAREKHTPGALAEYAARSAEENELAGQAHLLRCIFGNPFRPVAFDPAWRTPTVTAVAQTIYAERRFADLPILADALEEAGCTSADLLAHCRSGGDHARGCWAVDLVLGKQ